MKSVRNDRGTNNVDVKDKYFFLSHFDVGIGIAYPTESYNDYENYNVECWTCLDISKHVAQRTLLSLFTVAKALNIQLKNPPTQQHCLLETNPLHLFDVTNWIVNITELLNVIGRNFKVVMFLLIWYVLTLKLSSLETWSEHASKPTQSEGSFEKRHFTSFKIVTAPNLSSANDTFQALVSLTKLLIKSSW